MNRYLRTITTLFLLVSLAPFAGARPHMGMSSGSSAATFAKIFGNNTAFSATAEMHVQGNNGRNAHTIDMKYYVRDGKVRMNMDLSKMGRQMTAEQLARMKQMGMEHYVIILHPGTDHHSVMIYPDLKAYIEVRPHNQAGKTAKPQITKTKVGTGKVDGHPCDKYELSVTRPDGSQGKMTEWEATDMHNFPIKLESTSDNVVSSIVFKNIEQTPPDAALFEVPKGYKQYASMRQLMMSQMRKMMGNLGNMMRMHMKQQQ